MIDAYFMHLLILIGIYSMLAISLQLSLGFSGLLNLGHIAFFGIGAYNSALLALNGAPYPICLIVAGVIPAIFGYLLAKPTAKLRGDYFALMTLGFSFMVYAVLLNWSQLTKGPLGLPGIPRPIILGYEFSNNYTFLILVVAVSILSYLFIQRLTNSPLGKALEATRDDELAVRSLGKDAFKLKSVSLVVSAFIAGLAGSLFATYLTYIDPSAFTFTNLIPVILIVIIAGIASLPGTIFATFIIMLLPELFRFVGLPSEVIGPVRQIFYALALILIVYFKPRGFYGKIDLE